VRLGSSRSVKLGVLLDGSIQGGWVLASVRQALSVPGVRLEAVGLVSLGNDHSLSGRLHRLIERIAEPKRARNDLLFAPVDVTFELAMPTLQIGVVIDDCSWSPDESGGNIMRRSGVDVWLCFTALPPRRRLCPVSRFGVWGLEIGRNVSATNNWAGAMEIAAQSPVTMVSLIDYEAAVEDVLYRSFGATVKDSALRSRMQALHKGVTFPRRLLEGLTRNGEIDLRMRPSTLGVPLRYPVEAAPRMTTLVKLWSRVLWNRIRDRLPSLPWTRQWQIGYYFADQNVTDCRFDQLRYLVPPRDRFWADPFAVEHQGRYFVFLEELPYATQKGRIVAIEVFENSEAGDAVVVLERPYHLSYPFVFCWEASLYMLPETAGNKTIEVYKCEEFPHRWCLHQVLIDNINAFDATLCQLDGRWWMFANVAGPAANSNDELYLFQSESPLGPWTQHPRNPVVSDVRFARAAGPLFSNQGVLHRPSQDCSVAYGHSIVINRVEILSDDDYQENIVSRISPGWRKDILRVHTYGGTKRLRVIDCLVRRPRRWWSWPSTPRNAQSGPVA